MRKATVNQTAGAMDFSLLTDGLRAEREQGITIDVAYRYFSTPRRKFIIADTPGHEQYTRNMATGASTANLAIILIDARFGVLQQSRRHAFIASLLAIPHIAVAVNKMDLVDYREDVFEQIRADFEGFAEQLQIADAHFIPVSALLGDNVVDRSERMPWFKGAPLLEYLETVHISHDRNLTEMRFPVQYVIRPNLDFRGYAGQVASGVIRKGDTVMVLPSGRTSQVQKIVTYEGEIAQAYPPMSVTVCLEDEIDISRGDMLVPPLDAPYVSTRFEAMAVWMNAAPLEIGRTYLVKHLTQQVTASVTAIRYRTDVNTLEKQETDRLELNEIGAISIETRRPLFFDPYRRNRTTGAFILIDPITNSTLGAGMITDRETAAGRSAGSLLDAVRYEPGTGPRVTAGERFARAGHRAATVWLSGVEEIAYLAERKLFDHGCLVHVLAGETESHILPELARISNAAGLITICSVPVDDPQERERARGVVGEERFVTVDAAAIPGGVDAAAEAVCRKLEEQGIIRERRSDPFTGGDGI